MLSLSFVGILMLVALVVQRQRQRTRPRSARVWLWCGLFVACVLFGRFVPSDLITAPAFVIFVIWALIQSIRIESSIAELRRRAPQ
jgi:uncharacterized membrane protein YdcZ (DUF606 family)